MKVNASVGNASKTTDLRDRCYSLDLRADTNGEKQFLAALYRAIMSVGFENLTILTSPYNLTIGRKQQKKKKGGKVE